MVKELEFWNSINPTAVAVGYAYEDGCWHVYQKDDDFGMSILGTISTNVFPELDKLLDELVSDKPQSIYLKPSRKEFLLNLVEKELEGLWKYIDPKYTWIAADFYTPMLTWVFYTGMPFEDKNSPGGWTHGPSDTYQMAEAVYIEIPSGIDWSDLRFQRPSGNNKKE